MTKVFQTSICALQSRSRVEGYMLSLNQHLHEQKYFMKWKLTHFYHYHILDSTCKNKMEQECFWQVISGTGITCMKSGAKELKPSHWQLLRPGINLFAKLCFSLQTTHSQQLHEHTSSSLKNYFDTFGWKIPSAKTQDYSMSCTKYFKYSGTCWATKGSAFSPSYTTNYPLTAEFMKSCWFLTPRRHRRKKKINLMIRPRIFSLMKPLPPGIKLFFSQQDTDTPKNNILPTRIHPITVSQICFTFLVIFSQNLNIRQIKENTRKKKKERLGVNLS